jgi:hypothetical protein
MTPQTKAGVRLNQGWDFFLLKHREFVLIGPTALATGHAEFPRLPDS